MDRLTFRRVLWVFHRAHLRHGALMWACVVAVVVLIGLVVSMAVSALHLKRLGTDLAMARDRALHGAPAATIPGIGREPLPLPSVARRFDITQRILKELQGKDFAPEKMRFKFEHLAEAGVTRQIAVFSVRTRWNEIAELLTGLQAMDRSIYIAKLRVARDSADDAMVDADIQLAVILRDDAAATGAAP